MVEQKTNVHVFAPREAIEEEASEWLVRLDRGEKPSTEQLAALSEWVNRSPAHRAEIKRLAEFWDNANILTELSIPLYNRQLKEAQSGKETQSGLFTTLFAMPRKLRLQSVAVIAALVLVAFVTGFNVWESNNSAFYAGNGLYETRVGEQNTIKLADGSVVLLNTNSNIQVDYSDARRTITLLQGEAHFDVSKDTSRPFEVYAADGRVKAVGTAFSVRLQNSALKVTVTEGTVLLGSVQKAGRDNVNADDAVRQQGDMLGPDSDSDSGNHSVPWVTDEGALQAGYSIVFKPRSGADVAAERVVLESRDMAKEMAWRGGMLLFTGEPLEEVVQEISRYTTRKIEIMDPAIAQLRIGGQFKVGETENLLKVLATNFNVDVQAVDADTVQLTKKAR